MANNDERLYREEVTRALSQVETALAILRGVQAMGIGFATSLAMAIERTDDTRKIMQENLGGPSKWKALAE